MSQNIVGIANRTSFVDYKGLTDVSTVTDLYDQIKRSKQNEVIEKNDYINKKILVKDVYGSTKSIFNTSLKFYQNQDKVSIFDEMDSVNVLNTTKYFIPSYAKLQTVYNEYCEKTLTDLSKFVDPITSLKGEKLLVYHKGSITGTPSWGMIKRFSVSLSVPAALAWNVPEMIKAIDAKQNLSFVGKIGVDGEIEVFGKGLKIKNDDSGSEMYFNIIDHYHNSKTNAYYADMEIEKKKKKNIASWGTTLVDIDFTNKLDFCIYEMYSINPFMQLDADVTKIKTPCKLNFPIQISVERFVTNYKALGEGFLNKVSLDVGKLLKLEFLNFFTKQKIVPTSSVLSSLYLYSYEKIIENPKTRKEFNNRMAYLRFIFRKRKMLVNILKLADTIIREPSMEKVKSFVNKIGEYNNMTKHSKSDTSVPNITGVALENFNIDTYRVIDTSLIKMNELGNGTGFQTSLVEWINSFPLLDANYNWVSKNGEVIESIIQSYDSSSYLLYEKEITKLKKEMVETIEGIEPTIIEHLATTSKMQKLLFYKSTVIQEFGLYYALFFDRQIQLDAPDVEILLETIKKHGIQEGFKKNIEYLLQALGKAEMTLIIYGNEEKITGDTYHGILKFFLEKLQKEPIKQNFETLIKDYLDFQNTSISVSTETATYLYKILKKILVAIKPEIDEDEDLLDAIMGYISWNIEYNFNNVSLSSLLNTTVSMIGVALPLNVLALIDSITSAEGILVRAILLSLKNSIIYVSIIDALGARSSFSKISLDISTSINEFKKTVELLRKAIIDGQRAKRLTRFFEINDKSVDYAYAVLSNKKSGRAVVGNRKRIFKYSLKSKEFIANQLAKKNAPTNQIAIS